MTKLHGVQIFGPVEEQTPDPWQEEMEYLMRDFNALIYHIDKMELVLKSTTINEPDLIKSNFKTQFQLGVLKDMLEQFLKRNQWAIMEKRNGNNF